MEPILVVFLLASLYALVSLLDRLLRSRRRPPLPALPREQPAPRGRRPTAPRRPPEAPPVRPSPREGPPSRDRPPVAAPRTAVDVAALRRRLLAPATLAEAVVVAEILRRPRSLRRR